MKYSMSLSIEMSLYEWLKNRFGRGNMSAYVSGLIQEDQATIQGTSTFEIGQSAEYARVMAILREEIHNTEDYKQFTIWTNNTLQEWMKETHANHDLAATLSEVINTPKLEELVRKWLKYADFTVDDIERFMKIG